MKKCAGYTREYFQIEFDLIGIHLLDPKIETSTNEKSIESRHIAIE